MSKYQITFLLCFCFIITVSSQSCQIFKDQEGEDISTCPILHDCIGGECIHKDVFPLTLREIVGCAILIVLSGLANSGGLGGGAILTPILLSVFNYMPTKAISIVYCMILGGSLGSFINTSQMRDKETGTPVVNYDLGLICLPLMLLGVQFGVLLNRFLPAIIPLIGLVILAYKVCKKTYLKANKEFAKETQQMALLVPLKQESNRAYELKPIGNNNKSDADFYLIQENPLLYQLLKREKKQFPMHKINEIIILTLGILTISIVRGSSKLPSVLGIQYCSIEYWVMYGLNVLFCIYSSKRCVKIITELDEQKQKFSSILKIPSTNVNSEQLPSMIMLSFWTGVLAGLIGIGGGMILGPYFLDLGISPQSLVATTGLFVVLTSFLSTFQTLLLGSLSFAEIIWYFIQSAIGSYLISIILSYLVKKYNRQSFLLYALCFVLALALIIVPTYGFSQLFDNPEVLLKFNSFC